MDFVSDDLIRYKRQILQRVVGIPLPPGRELKDEGVQKWLVRDIFNDRLVADLGATYLKRQLDRIITAIEKAVTDPAEEEVSNDLYELRARLASSSAKEQEREAIDPQKKLVRYHAPTDLREPAGPTEREQYISILEKPQVLGYGSDTGNRTWEASLRLMHYLSAHPELIRDRNVLELGAGSGLLSIYCAAVLGAKTVIATDISRQILQACQENIDLNSGFWTGTGTDTTTPPSQGQGQGQDQCRPPVLRELDLTDPNLSNVIQTELQDSEGKHIVPDIILAADVIYDPEVASALGQGLATIIRNSSSSSSSSKEIEVIVSATVRNLEVLEARFERSFALKRGLEYERADESWQLSVDAHEQNGLFHAVANEIRLYHRKPGMPLLS